MSRNNYSGGRRQREAEKARKKREKAERRRRNKQSGGGIPVATVEELQPAAVDISNEEALARKDARPAARRRPASRLFVGQLSWDTTTESLTRFFEQVGEVEDAIVMTDRDTGRSRGFGFVNMVDQKAAQAAIDKLDGKELDGREIRVNVATER